MSVELRHKAVVIDGCPTFLFSAELIPYRLPGSAWADRLEKLRAAGLNSVGLYFAWNFHSAAKGQADFASPDRDLGRLLQLAQDLGLHVIARPGPYVCNEWDLGGYPAWLMGEDAGDWRSGDPRHLAFCRDWYRQVNAVLARHQHGAGGPIVLYQIENEHRWNDRAFLGGLCDAARADGIVVPLIGNHDGGGLCVLDKLAEGTDIYTPPFEFCRWRGWLETLSRRLGPDLPLMVLEFRCGEHPLWGQPEVSSAWPPAHWTLSQTRLFLGVGANVVNHFVGAGGITPIGYNSDHIPTSYVDNPPVAPWGELTERFYEMRLLGLCQESFNQALAESVPVPGGWGTDDVQVECLLRRGPRGSFLVLANHANEARRFHLLPEGRPLPGIGEPLAIGPLRTKLLVADADLGDGLRLTSCSLSILAAWTHAGQTTLIVYGDPGETAAATFARGPQTVTLNARCTAAVGVARTTLAGRELALYAVPETVAARTWLPRHRDGRVVPLFGMLPLMRPQTRPGDAVCLEVPAAAAGLALVVPAATAPGLRLNGARPELGQPRPDGMAELTFVLPPVPAPAAAVGHLEFAPQSEAWTTAPAAPADGWQPVRAWGPAAAMLLQPGDYEWRCDFAAQAPLPNTLEFLGLSQGEFTVYLNGELLGCWPPQRRATTNQCPAFNAVFDIRRQVRTGTNHLAVHLHFHGRHNSGQPIHVGFTQPVALRRGPRRELVQAQWRVAPIGSRKWQIADLAATPAFDTADWEEVDLSRPNQHQGPAGTGHHHEVRWYWRRIAIPKAFRNGPLFLECPPVEEAWAYVNGQPLGHTRCASSTAFDLTPVAAGTSVDVLLAVRHNWFFWTDRFGLGGAPRLVAPGRLLDPDWQLRGSPLPRPEPWQGLDLAWSGVRPEPVSRRLWVRCPVTVSVPPERSAPFYVELTGWRSRAVLYWNGQPLGLYGETGPQTRFYVPEALLQRENTVHLRVDGYRGPATLGTLTAGFYFDHRCLSLTL